GVAARSSAPLPRLAGFGVPALATAPGDRSAATTATATSNRPTYPLRVDMALPHGRGIAGLPATSLRHWWPDVTKRLCRATVTPLSGGGFLPSTASPYVGYGAWRVTAAVGAVLAALLAEPDADRYGRSDALDQGVRNYRRAHGHPNEDLRRT